MTLYGYVFSKIQPLSMSAVLRETARATACRFSGGRTGEKGGALNFYGKERGITRNLLFVKTALKHFPLLI
jgi:hypothetical protein